MKDQAYMTMEITDEVLEKAREALIKARMTLLFKHPFFGQLALRLTLTPADRKWCPTAATDVSFCQRPGRLKRFRAGI